MSDGQEVILTVDSDKKLVIGYPPSLFRNSPIGSLAGRWSDFVPSSSAAARLLHEPVELKEASGMFGLPGGFEPDGRLALRGASELTDEAVMTTLKEVMGGIHRFNVREPVRVHANGEVLTLQETSEGLRVDTTGPNASPRRDAELASALASAGGPPRAAP